MNYLEECKKVLEDRQKQYGSSIDVFSAVAGFWTEYLEQKYDNDLTREDVAIMMVLFKIAREMFKHKNDNIIDAINYLILSTDYKNLSDILSTK